MMRPDKAAMPAITIEGGPVPEHAMTGGIEGAERSTRELALWSPPIISPDRQINHVKDEADARGRDIIQNDGLAMGAVHTHRDSVVGNQFRLIAQPNYEILGATEAWAEEFITQVESEFNLFADSPQCWFDAAGKMTLTGMLRLIVGGFLFTGEVLATVEWLRDTGRPFSTALQVISPARLSNPDLSMDTPTMSRGVEHDRYGRPLAYHIRTEHPGDFYMSGSEQRWKRVEARKPWGRLQVIHIIDPLQPDQTRGVADMVSALKQMKMTKKFQDITLQNAVVNATYAAAIESDLPSEVVFASMGAGGEGMAGMLGEYMDALNKYTGAADNIALDGVKMPHLFPGTKLNLKPAGTPGGVGTGYEESLLRHIAASLGMSYEQYSKDLSKTNYSSLRAGIAESQKSMDSRKKSVADPFATNVYVLWLEERINAGKVKLPPGMTKDIFYDPLMREALTACSWIGAARGQVDEVKESQAAIMRINAGLSTYQIESARLGEDFRRLFKQQAREKKMMKELGLDFQADATKPGTNDRQQTMTKKETADEE